MCPLTIEYVVFTRESASHASQTSRAGRQAGRHAHTLASSAYAELRARARERARVHTHTHTHTYTHTHTHTHTQAYKVSATEERELSARLIANGEHLKNITSRLSKCV